jgi:hypothetical protein
MRKRFLLLALLGALAVPASGTAAPGISFGIQDDAWLNGGTLDERLSTLDRLGPDVVRYTLRWDQVARKRPARAVNPSDKAYDWRSVDAVLTGLRKHHIGVLVTLYGAPGWANGHHAANFAPRSKTSLASFAFAAAKRYPWIRMWEIWNEPNLRTFLRPSSPSIYVQRLLNPTYNALHHLRRGMRVAGGATSPRKTPSGIAPVTFMRGMHAAHARLDAYSHHPYPVAPHETPTTLKCRYCKGVLTMARLPELLKEVKRDFGNKRIWLTEYGYQTNPPDRHLGVSKALQARYLAQAAYMAYKAPRVDLLVHFIVRDEAKIGRWQSGLFTVGGTQKPSFDSFALPLVQVSRRGSRTALWGQDRPGLGRQKYVLERFASGRWRPVGGAKLTTQRGYVGRVVKAIRGARFRLRDVNTKAKSLVLVVR